jgi:hypothetical protein
MGFQSTRNPSLPSVASSAWGIAGSGPRIEVRSGGAWASKYAKPLHYQVRACTGGRSSPSNAYGDPARQRRNEGKTLSFRGAAWSWNFSPAEFWPGARNSADRARRRKSPTACTATCGSSGRAEIAVRARRPILSLEFLRISTHKCHFIASRGHRPAPIEQNLAPPRLAPP